MSSVLLKNIGTIVSGDISAPILEGNAILAEDGKIKKVGNDAVSMLSGRRLYVVCMPSG